jgi:hypothetical protein
MAAVLHAYVGRINAAAAAAEGGCQAMAAAPSEASHAGNLQLFIALILAAVAFGFFAVAAAQMNYMRTKALLIVAAWLLVAVAVAMLVTVVVL